jgi:selenide,water dikinase
VALAEEGHLTGGCKRNRAYLQDKVAVEGSIATGLVEVAFDPQTSGGLLIALPDSDAPRLVAALRNGGVDAAAIIGRVTKREPFWVGLV